MSVADDSSAAEPNPSRRASVHRVVWRWHFYAGLFVAPVLFVIALTGGIYIFKDDVEPFLYAEARIVAPQATRVPLSDVVAAAEKHVGAGGRVTFLTLFADPTCAAKAAVQKRDGKRPVTRQVWIDPYTARVTGEVPWFDFFDIVRSLHRRLFLSTIGRILTELATSWAIVLVGTGLYLWFPRRLTQVGGVWRPRLTAKPYVVLRDFHALSGVYLAPLVLLIALTGLYYSSMIGWFFDQANAATKAYAVFTPPSSRSAESLKPLTLDEAAALAKTHFLPDSTLSVTMPKQPGDSWLFAELTPDQRAYLSVVALDGRSGEVLRKTPESEFSPMMWLGNWVYPLHVGNVLGWPTKLLWCGACLVLMFLPVTGYLMWQQRKPPDAWGLPRNPVGRRPWALVALAAGVAVLLPAVGLSIVAVLAYERFALRSTRPT